MGQKEIWKIRKRVQRLVVIDTESRCKLCDSQKNLHRHHRDGNIRNNDLSNIVVLCRRCHIKAHLAMGTWSHGLDWDSLAAD
jgi:hypothetical protein